MIESCIESSNNLPWLPGHNPSYLTNRSKIADVLLSPKTRVFPLEVGGCKIGRGQGCVFQSFLVKIIVNICYRNTSEIRNKKT